jgi:hypothetical protein
MTENDVREMCRVARIRIKSVTWQGKMAVVDIGPLTVNPQTTAANLYKAGAGGVTYSWNGGDEQVWITEKKSA